MYPAQRKTLRTRNYVDLCIAHVSPVPSPPLFFVDASIYFVFQEFARCRRLNKTLSSALGSRACGALEDAASWIEGDGEGGGGGGGGAGGGGGGDWSPLPPPGSLCCSTSGMFRRVLAARVPDPASPPLPPMSPPPPPLLAPVVASEGGGDGLEAYGKGLGLGLPSAEEVKRGLRFCMKVHRFKEMCRPGSCVAFRKVRGRHNILVLLPVLGVVYIITVVALLLAML